MFLLRQLRAKLATRGLSREEVFTKIARENAWGSEESVSGPGSTTESAARATAALPSILSRHAIRSVLELGCGDHTWLASFDFGDVDYLGFDIVEEVVLENQRRYGSPTRRFEHRDVVACDSLPAADLVICRDVLYHLPTAEALAVVEKVARSEARYLLVTTHPDTHRNRDIVTGSFAFQNLSLPPFDLPPPVESLDDAYDEVLGLWDTASLRRRFGV